jgi:hypothetical protein
MHPQILRAEFTPADGTVKVFVFGFERKKKPGGGIDKEDDGEKDNGKDSEKDGIGVSEGIEESAERPRNDDIDDGGIAPPGAVDPPSGAGESGDVKKKRALFSRVKSRFDAVKRSRLYGVFCNRPLRERLMRWIRSSLARVLRVVSIERLKLRARVGMRDPAALGRLYGYFSAARSALVSGSRNVELAMEPVFTEKRLDVDFEIRAKTTPSVVLWNLAALAATFPYRRLRRAMKRPAASNRGTAQSGRL